MATQSSRERKMIQMDIGDLSIKFFKCIDLINQGKRTDSEIATLSQALQLFREGRLAGAMTKVFCEAKEKCPRIAMDRAGKDFSERLQKILNLKTEESTLPVDLRFRLIKSGIFYIGEILMVMGSSWMRKEEETLREFFISTIGIDLSTENVLDVAILWHPPYWDDPDLRKKFDLPLSEALEIGARLSFVKFLYYLAKENFPNFHEKEKVVKDQWARRGRSLPGLEKFAGIFTLGELFQLRVHKKQLGRWKGWRIESLNEIQSALKPELFMHAGMILPPNWLPPHRDEPLS